MPARRTTATATATATARAARSITLCIVIVAVLGAVATAFVQPALAAPASARSAAPDGRIDAALSRVAYLDLDAFSRQSGGGGDDSDCRTHCGAQSTCAMAHVRWVTVMCCESNSLRLGEDIDGGCRCGDGSPCQQRNANQAGGSDGGNADTGSDGMSSGNGGGGDGGGGGESNQTDNGGSDANNSGGGNGGGGGAGDSAGRRAFELTNQFRQQNGVSPTKWSDVLHRDAKAWSQEMADSGNFRHQSLNNPIVDVPGVSLRGENIAMHSAGGSDNDPGAKCFNQWKNSPGHRKNMLTAGHQLSAVGVVQASDGAYYCTQVFGVPA